MTTPAMLRALAEGRNVLDATPAGIERSEKAGQTALVNSTDMPIDLRPDRATFEKIGFTFGEKIDELFVHATLPPGWTRAATKHSMHSDILDQHGRRRVGVFYKAAFYDRRADAYLIQRYAAGAFYGDLDAGRGIAADERASVVLDVDKEIYRAGVAKRSDYNAWSKLDDAAREWLKEHFPQANDPTAYWDAV